MLGLGKDGEESQIKKRHINELYSHIGKIIDSIRNRRVTFRYTSKKMNTDRLVRRISNYLHKLKVANTWIKETEKDRSIEELLVTQEKIGDIRIKLITEMKRFPEHSHRCL